MRLIAYCLLLIAFVVSGCAVRTGSHRVDRVDQEIKGNRGVIMGTKKFPKTTARRKTRTVYDLEIELPALPSVPSIPFLNAKKKESTKKITTTQAAKDGNKGYVKKNQFPEQRLMPAAREQKGITRLGGASTSTRMPRVVYQSSKPASAKTKSLKEEAFYVVKKGDTLQKISDKVYGTTKRWKNIYEANRKVLKSPNKIKPGQKLVIPQE